MVPVRVGIFIKLNVIIEAIVTIITLFHRRGSIGLDTNERQNSARPGTVGFMQVPLHEPRAADCTVVIPVEQREVIDIRINILDSYQFWRMTIRKTVIHHVRPVIRAQEERLVEAVIRVHIPAGDDDPVGLAIQIAFTAVHDCPAVMAVAVQNDRRIIGSAINAVRARITDMLHFKRDRTADIHPFRGDDCGRSWCIIFQIGCDAEQVLVAYNDFVRRRFGRHGTPPKFKRGILTTRAAQTFKSTI